jgi:hypothetical protein
VLLPLRTTPSVAEQEGQLIETEATGAPQTPSYTKSVSWQHHLGVNEEIIRRYVRHQEKMEQTHEQQMELLE